MAASLTFEAYVDALTTAAARLREDTADLPEERFVPTCREWSALQLVAHTGTVHRWATGVIHGDLDLTDAAATDGFLEEGMHSPDPGAWLLAGTDGLAHALRDAPGDLAPFFDDAPDARISWARRQCHETTIHAFDGLAARLGQVPTAADADLDPAVATDGIDEILRDFAVRGRRALRTSRPISVVIRTTDTDASWTLRLSEGPAVCEHGQTVPDPDAVWSGTAAQLYLGLWNRGREVVQEGADVIGFWRDQMQIKWT